MTRISPTSVHRNFSRFGLRPHRTETFKLSTDPLFIEKLRDVVGLYLNPPDNALVLCVDEKSQCQALERNQPMFEVHCIVDNDSCCKHPKVKACLVAGPRWNLHFIPTYSSWLNQVERFFSNITDKAIRRGSFRSVEDQTSKIDHFVTHYNRTCKPFTWTATADSIIAKLERLCART